MLDIQTHTEPSQWRYVSTTLNPVDKITRGMTVKGIANSNSWWSVPLHLGTNEDEWLNKKYQFNTNKQTEKEC